VTDWHRKSLMQLIQGDLEEKVRRKTRGRS
jgi:hypothetical protein